MSKYIYKSPVDNGFIKFKLSRRQHKKLFPKIKRNWMNHRDYYISKDEFIMHGTPTILFKIVAILFFPVFVLLGGFLNIKQMIQGYYDLFHVKGCGDFEMNSVDSGTEKYKEIVQLSKVKFKC